MKSHILQFCILKFRSIFWSSVSWTFILIFWKFLDEIFIGVADQLQTNFASDLRSILKTVFEVTAANPMSTEDITHVPLHLHNSIRWPHTVNQLACDPCRKGPGAAQATDMGLGLRDGRGAGTEATHPTGVGDQTMRVSLWFLTCSQRSESRSESRFDRSWFWPFPDITLCERKALSNRAFETRKKGVWERDLP